MIDGTGQDDWTNYHDKNVELEARDIKQLPKQETVAECHATQNTKPRSENKQCILSTNNMIQRRQSVTRGISFVYKS